jgi:hypothetical protein
VNQAEEVWAFCKQFSLAGNTAIRSPVQVVSPGKAVSVTFRSGSIQCDGFADVSRISVMDTRGRVVAQTGFKRNSVVFGGMPGGIYITTVTSKGSTDAFRIVVP